MPLQIFDYQKVGAKFLSERTRAGLFDQMRVGKSAQAVRAADMLLLRRGIVICPAVAREVWRGEFAKFGILRRSVVKGVTIHDFVSWMRGTFDVLVTSFEQATKWAARIRDMGEILDFVIVDEGHYLKNFEAQRTKAILGDFTLKLHEKSVPGIVDYARYSWILTGTPMANDPADIYTFLRFCNTEARGNVMPLSRGLFQRLYFSTFKKTFGERNAPRPDKLAELRRMIENNSLRRTQAEAGLQFPPIWFTSITLDGDTTAIRELLAQWPGLEPAIVAAVKTGGVSFLDAQHIATLRRLVAEAKAIPYAELLYEELQNTDQKYVVMGISKRALIMIQDYLIARGITAYVINGDTSEKQRVALMESFQTDPTSRVMLCNLFAAGTAISLTAACNVDMFESAWAPGPNAQGLMRVQGISQKRNITARWVTLVNTIDEAVNEIVAEKTAAIAQVQGSEMFVSH